MRALLFRYIYPFLPFAPPRPTGLVCSRFVGVSVLSRGVQLFDKVGGKQSRLAVEVAVPPALLNLHGERQEEM